MKKYLAILSKPCTDRITAQNHITRAMSNSTQKIKRNKLFVLYMLIQKKYYGYRVCRIVTEIDIRNSGYSNTGKRGWRQHLEAHTKRVRAWLNENTTLVIENNQVTLSMIEGL